MLKVKVYCCFFIEQNVGMNVIHMPVTKCDSGTQTDTHFMESNLVKSYEWNEWELRRRAIKLVTVKNINCNILLVHSILLF